MPTVKEIREKALKKTRKELKESMYERDHLIVQIVRTVDELDKVINTLAERLRDWYAVYNPELEREHSELEEYVKAISENGKKKRKDSIGADLPDSDVEKIIDYAKHIESLIGEKEEITGYMETLVLEEAPNLKELVGPTLAARLISGAGSLRKLASMPSSTIQVLGAEKALFAHLKKKNVPSPKHGIIFMHPEVRSSKKKDRGKIARRLAGKISIAASVDYYHGAFIGDKLKEELEREIQKVKA